MVCRYLETAALVYSWYQTDVWEKESLSSVMMRRVNAMHRLSFLTCPYLVMKLIDLWQKR